MLTPKPAVILIPGHAHDLLQHQPSRPLFLANIMSLTTESRSFWSQENPLFPCSAPASCASSGQVPIRGEMKGWGSPSSLSRENTAKTFPESSANPLSHCGKSHKERFSTKDRIAQLARLSSKVTSKHRPNSSPFNHKSRKSPGMDGHALGLGHISCCHVFPSAEIKSHKTQHYINVLLPCEPPTSKVWLGSCQRAGRWWHRALPLPAAGTQPAIFLQK